MAYTYSRVAREFPSQEALRDYLREHPDADKALHHVKKDDGKRDPREYARERAKFAPPKRKEPFVGIPTFKAHRVVARYLEARGGYESV